MSDLIEYAHATIKKICDMSIKTEELKRTLNKELPGVLVKLEKFVTDNTEHLDNVKLAHELIRMIRDLEIRIRTSMDQI